MTTEVDQLRQELVEHREWCQTQFTEGSRQFEEIRNCIVENTNSVGKLTEETREMRQLYADVKGAIRIGIAAQRFWVWMLKWPVIGGALAAIALWFKEQFPS